MSGTLQDLLAQAAGLLRMVERALQSDARGVEHPWFKVSYYREYFERYAELAESLRTKHPRFAKLPERGVPAGSPEDTAGGEPLFGRGEMEKLRGDLEFVLTAASSLDNVARRETPLSNTAIPSAQVGTATSGLVFISWSGPSSEQVASALRDWLPTVLRGLEVWLSSKDIAKGARWGPAISQKLDQTSFGIACVVPGNEKAPWLLFEAGAASKSVEEGRLSPFLFGVSPEELPPALGQFQCTGFERDEVLSLVHDINVAPGGPDLPVDLVGTAFERQWPSLQARLQPLLQSMMRSELENEPSPRGDRWPTPESHVPIGLEFVQRGIGFNGVSVSPNEHDEELGKVSYLSAQLMVTVTNADSSPVPFQSARVEIDEIEPLKELTKSSENMQREGAYDGPGRTVKSAETATFTIKYECLLPPETRLDEARSVRLSLRTPKYPRCSEEIPRRFWD